MPETSFGFPFRPRQDASRPVGDRHWSFRHGLTTAKPCLVCPITSAQKGYPFEAALPAGFPVDGVVLSDHVKSSDWGARRIEFICRAPAELLAEVRAKIQPLVGT